MIKRQFQYFVKITLLSLISLSCNKIIGQIIPPPDQPHNFWENVRFGGGIGLGFGDGFFSGTLAPSAIYQFNPQFAVGVGLSGTYNNQKNRYTSTILGGSIMTFYNIIPRSEEHTSELQSRPHLVCRLLLEKKKKKIKTHT